MVFSFLALTILGGTFGHCLSSPEPTVISGGSRTHTLLIVYHLNCHDGVTAAWVFWSKYGNNAQYYGITAGSSLNPELYNQCANRKVIFVDVCLSLADMTKIQKVANKLFILDHHQCNEQTIKKIGGIYSSKKSGCELAWNYVYGTKIPPPKFLLYVADKDLFTRKYEETTYFIDAVHYKGKILSSIDKIDTLSKSKDMNKYIAFGKFLRQNIYDPLIRSLPYYMADYGEYKVILVQNLLGCLQSDIGYYLSEMYSDRVVLILEYYPKKKGWSSSIRGIAYQDNNILYTSQDIAKTFGGNGHLAAAGAVIGPSLSMFTNIQKITPLSTFPYKREYQKYFDHLFRNISPYKNSVPNTRIIEKYLVNFFDMKNIKLKSYYDFEKYTM